MTSPAFKVIKKVSVGESISGDKNEEKIIQINVSSNPGQIFPAVRSEPLHPTNNAKDFVNPDSKRSPSPVSMPIVQLEIGDSDSNPTTLTESKPEQSEGEW